MPNIADMPYDDRDGDIWMNGKFVPWREANIHFLTHSLHYGGAVFEGIRAYSGQIFKLHEHSQRLIDSAKIIGYDLPYTVEELDQFTQETFERSGHRDAYIRPLAWRGAEEMGLGAHNCKIHVAIAAWFWPSYFPDEIVQNGLRLKTSSWRRPAPDTAPVHAKASGLYMISTLSKHESEAAGYHDALMLDYRGRVAECTGANIFMVKDGALFTPDPDCFLNGITRQTVIDLAKERGYDVNIDTIMPEDILKADEIFVTGTAYEVLPIGRIDQTDFKVGPITKELRQAYHDLAGIKR